VSHDRVADVAAAAHHHREETLRQAGVPEGTREQQRRERRGGGRLEHHGASGGDRGGDLVGHEVQREVERCDGADHTHGLLQHHAEVTGAGGAAVHRHHLAGQRARLHGRERERVDAAGGLPTRLFDRLPGFQADGACEGLGALGDEAGRAFQDRGALVGRRGREVATRLGDGGIDVVGTTAGDGRDGVAGVRVDHGHLLSAILESPVHEDAGWLDRIEGGALDGHGATPHMPGAARGYRRGVGVRRALGGRARTRSPRASRRRGC